MDAFQANGLPVLIGSLPLDNHMAATKLVGAHTPEIPLWVQLPVYPEETMIAQFLPGLPGIERNRNGVSINVDAPSFDAEYLQFYEDYLAVSDGKTDLSESRFVLTEDTAKGFFVFLDYLAGGDHPPVALKGQITGPVTFGTGVKDRHGKAIFYDERLRDAAVKLLSLKARWQARTLSRFGCPVLIFIDEPALAGFGSSALIGIGREETTACLEELIDGIHSEGGIAGVHVCGNVDWSFILDSSVDVVSFDAYSYFDRFLLYADHIKAFLDSDRVLAWGIVPTGNVDDIDRETADSLAGLWIDQANALEALGIPMAKLLKQSLITPSCGTGALDLYRAKKVLKLTRQVSDRLRNRL